MPCYITYRCFGYITDEELEKFIDMAKEKGFSLVDRNQRMISFRDKNGVDFTLVSQGMENQWAVNSSNRRMDVKFLDDVKSTMNRNKFEQKWRSKNPGWNVQQVRI